MLLMCYNEPLAQQLATDLRGVENLRVSSSFHQLCGQVLRQAGVELEQGPRDATPFFADDLPGAALAHVGDASLQKYDALVGG